MTGMSLLGRESNQCQGSQGEKSIERFQNRKKVSVAGVQWTGETDWEWDQTHRQGLPVINKEFGFDTEHNGKPSEVFQQGSDVTYFTF